MSNEKEIPEISVEIDVEKMKKIFEIPSAKEIAEAIQRKAQKLGIKGMDGLSEKLEKDFSERLERLMIVTSRLRECPGPHQFRKTEDGDYVCSVCSGTVGEVEAYWYQAGLKHGLLTAKELSNASS